MGVYNCEYPYFTMKPKRLQRRSQFHAMFIKYCGPSAVGKKEPGYVCTAKLICCELSLLCHARSDFTDALKFVFSEKATKFDEIFTLLLTNTLFSEFRTRLLNFCQVIKKMLSVFRKEEFLFVSFLW